MKMFVVLALIRVCGGAGSGVDGGDGPANDDAVFGNAEDLACDELALAWARNLDDIARGWLSCTIDSDCAVVPTSIVCGEVVNLASCETAVMSSHVSDYNAARDEAGIDLCGNRSSECLGTSLCPTDLAASCVDSICRVQAP